MANEKKIAKSQKLLLYQLGEALKLEEKLKQEPDSKKQAKIQKKIESSNKMILYYGKNIGQEGGTLESIWDQLTERQQQIIQELFPYGIKSDELAQQEKRHPHHGRPGFYLWHFAHAWRGVWAVPCLCAGSAGPTADGRRHAGAVSRIRQWPDRLPG